MLVVSGNVGSVRGSLILAHGLQSEPGGLVPVDKPYPGAGACPWRRMPFLELRKRIWRLYSSLWRSPSQQIKKLF